MQYQIASRDEWIAARLGYSRSGRSAVAGAECSDPGESSAPVSEYRRWPPPSVYFRFRPLAFQSRCHNENPCHKCLLPSVVSSVSDWGMSFTKPEVGVLP